MAWSVARLRQLVTLLLLGALALWLMPTLFNQMGEHMLAQPFIAGAWGFLVMIVGYTGAIFAAILLIALVAAFAAMTLAGLATGVFALGFTSLGLAFTIFELLVAYGSKLVVFYPLAHLFFEKTLPSWNRFWGVPLVVGTLVYVLLSSIPWFGLVLNIVVTLIGIGAMWMAVRDRLIQPRPAAPQLVLKTA
jgi:hypothetical protein